MAKPNSPRYVVKRVDDRYELVREIAAAGGCRVCALCGAAATIWGTWRRGFTGLAMTALGVSLLYWQWPRGGGQAPRRSGRPVRTGQHPDEVEEASMGSFPASDAPSHTTTSTGSRSKPR